MTKDDICKWMHMAWNFTNSEENLKRKFEYHEVDYLPYERFAKLVADHEREKVAKWMMGQGYATGHGDTIEDLLKELGWQVAEREREACAKLCDEQSDKDGFEGGYANECAELIRSRGIDGAKVGEVGVWCEK